MFRDIKKYAIAAAPLMALASAAQAGTATGSGTANFNVVTQCSITGANVNLGTYTANGTLMDVGRQLGYTYSTVGSQVVGSTGLSAITWGKVNCNAGTPYTLFIQGTNPWTGIGLNIGGKTAYLVLFVTSIGGQPAPYTGPGWSEEWGSMANGYDGVVGVGTGQDQVLKGAAPVYFAPEWGTAAETDKLVAGTYTDNLTYTLNF